MKPLLYTQLVHLIGIVAVAVLTGVGVINRDAGITILAGLVGVALPSPFESDPTPPAAGH